MPKQVMTKRLADLGGSMSMTVVLGEEMRYGTLCKWKFCLLVPVKCPQCKGDILVLINNE